MSSESEEPLRLQQPDRRPDIIAERMQRPIDGTTVRGKGYKGGRPAETMPPPPTNVPSVALAPQSPPEPNTSNVPSSDNAGGEQT